MEEHFKNKLSQHKVAWNKSELLDNLKRELTHDKKKKKRKWFLMFSILFIGLSVLTYYFFDSGIRDDVHMVTHLPHSNKISADSSFVRKEKSTETNSNQKNTSIEYNKKINLHSETQTNKMTNQVDLSGKDLTSNPQHELSTDSGQSNSTDLIIKNDTQPAHEENVGHIPFSTISISNHIQKQNVISPASSITDSTSPNLQRENEPESKTTTINYGFNSGVSSRIGHSAPSLDTHNNIDDTVTLQRIFSNPSFSYLPTIELDKIFSYDKFKYWTFKEPNVTSFTTTSSKARFPWFYSMGIEGGLVIRNRQYTSENNKIINLLEANDERERSLFAIFTNVSAGYKINIQWSVETGLEYGQIHEVFHYEDINVEELRAPTEKVLFSFIENTDTTLVLDTIFTTRTEEHIVRHYNKHVFYSIPIRFSYQFDFNNAKLTSRFGLSYAFSNTFRGKVSQVIEDTNKIIDNPSFNLRNRIGLMAGLAIEYPIFRHNTLFVSASYRRSPQLSTEFIQQIYHSISFGIGVKIPIYKNNN